MPLRTFLINRGDKYASTPNKKNVASYDIFRIGLVPRHSKQRKALRRLVRTEFRRALKEKDNKGKIKAINLEMGRLAKSERD